MRSLIVSVFSLCIFATAAPADDKPPEVAPPPRVVGAKAQLGAKKPTNPTPTKEAPPTTAPTPVDKPADSKPPEPLLKTSPFLDFTLPLIVVGCFVLLGLGVAIRSLIVKTKS